LSFVSGNLSLLVVIDRSWINTSRISDVYEKGVEDFLKFARRNGTAINGRYYCPCVKCVNLILIRLDHVVFGTKPTWCNFWK